MASNLPSLKLQAQATDPPEIVAETEELAAAVLHLLSLTYPSHAGRFTALSEAARRRAAAARQAARQR